VLFNTVWTYDIYKSVLNKKASDTHLLWMGRASTIVGVIISLVTGVLGKRISQYYGLYAGNLFMGQCTAVCDHATGDVSLVDYSEWGILGSRSGNAFFSLNVFRRQVSLVCREYHHHVECSKRHGCKFLARMVGVADLCMCHSCSKLVHKQETERRTLRTGKRIDQGNARSGYPVYEEAGILCDYFFDRLYSIEHLVLVIKEKHYV